MLALERNAAIARTTGGIAHFGFRLKKPEDVALAIAQVEHAGGELLRSGEFAPGYPFSYVAELDGYEIDLWFE